MLRGGLVKGGMVGLIWREAVGARLHYLTLNICGLALPLCSVPYKKGKAIHSTVTTTSNEI